MADLIKIRRDTKAHWDAVSGSVILQEGEIGIITDTAPKQCKIGNGYDVWGALPYQSWVDPGKLEDYDRKDLGYVVCSTGGGQAAKVVNDPATLVNYELGKNVRLLIKMNHANTASGSITLAINGTDAKPLQYNGAAASRTNTWANNEVLDVYYDGTNYIANTHGGAQFATGQKVGNVSIESSPVSGSTNLVTSNGIFEAVTNLSSSLNVQIGNVSSSLSSSIDNVSFSTGQKVSDIGIGNVPGTSQTTLMSQKSVTDLTSEYNVSTNNNNAEYTFAQAVALVPASLKKGGLTIKYIDSTTHEYVIKRLISSTWNTTESNWQGIDDEPTAESDNLVKSGGVYSQISQLDQEVSETSEDVLYCREGVGDVKTNEEAKTLTDLTERGMNGSVGSALNFTATPNYKTASVEVLENERYKVTTYSSVSNTYPYYVYLTDSNNIIKKTLLPKGSVLDTVSIEFLIPEGVTRLWVLQYNRDAFIMSIAKVTLDSLQHQIVVNEKELHPVVTCNVGNLGNTKTKVNGSFSFDGVWNWKAGHKYFFVLKSWDSTAFYEQGKDRYAFRLEWSSDGTNYNNIYSRNSAGGDFSGEKYLITIPTTAVKLRLAGRCVGGVIDICDVAEYPPYEIVKEATKDYENRFYPEKTLTVNATVSGNNLLSLNTGEQCYIISVKQNDVIELESKNALTYYALAKEFPDSTMDIDFMTGYSSRVQLTDKVTVTCPEDGVLLINTSNPSTVPSLVKINGETIFPTLEKRVNYLENGGSWDDELNETSTNPVQNKVLTPLIQNNKMLSDHGMFDLESDWWIIDRYLNSEYSENEAVALDAFKTKFRARQGSGVYQIAVISDTHGSGAYSWANIFRSNPRVCHRSIAVFNEIAGYCDAAFHGGDLSCDYGTSRLCELQYMYEIVRKFCFNKPFFITKGNHDENNNTYVEADMLHLDWDNNTYYTRNFSTFASVTEDTWDGSPLFVSKTELISDSEFRGMVQHWLCPSGAVWGNGAYYYYDIESLKIRFIVANSFPVNDNHAVYENEEYLWFAQEALNLSSKDNPQEWQVMVLRHTQSTSITALTNCINAFRNGTSWTYEGVTVDFGSVNGGGCTFIAHIHGHEHQWCFSNGAGYFDIGENSSFVNLNELGDATKYGISVLTIDTVNKKIYEDTIAGNAWCYDYLNGYAEVGVGNWINCAESGLARPVTCSSSDTSIATCSGRIITGVSAGTVTITVSGNNGNTYSYLVKVV